MSCKPQASAAAAARRGPVTCGPPRDWCDSIATRRIADRPEPVVDVDQALRTGWLELWYQPKIDSQTLDLCGAEALVRLRHPRWGVVLPAGFVSGIGDSHFHALSRFVVDQALADWCLFLAKQQHLDLSINLPIAFLEDSACIEHLYRRLPDHPDFAD